MREYEEDRWRIVAGKVGNGFSAAACRDKAGDLEKEDEGRGEAEVKEEAGSGELTPRVEEEEGEGT